MISAVESTMGTGIAVVAVIGEVVRVEHTGNIRPVTFSATIAVGSTDKLSSGGKNH